MRITILSQH